MRTLSPTTKTAFVAAGLALTGAGLAASASRAPLVPGIGLPVPHLVLGGVLALLFCLTELNLLHTEFLRQAYSFTLSGIPLIAGLLLLPARDLVIARVVGALLAFLVQRPTWIKGLFNGAMYLAEPALDITVLSHLLGHDPRPGLATALTCAATMVAVDFLMGCSVLAVIWFHQGDRFSFRSGVREVLLPAAVFSLCCSTLGISGVLLLHHGWLGVGMLVGLVASIAGLYRGYRMLFRRHEALTLMHEFVSDNTGVADSDEEAARLLTRARALMRAGHAELRLASGQVRLTADEQDRVTHETGAEEDWLLARVRETGDPVLLPRGTREPSTGAWLAAREVADAIIVALPSTDSSSRAADLLVITDRLGDTTTFTDEDLKLAQMLAAHLSVALRNVQLVERLRHDAHHDALTGLPNRALFNDRLELALAHPSGGSVAVLLLDLDRFKEVNDTLGHHVGDQLLVVLGQRLAEELPTATAVARLGGDEFAVLLTGNGLDADRAFAQARRVARALSQPVWLAEATLSCQVSVGVSVAEEGLPAADLLRHADTAMYAAKESAIDAVVYTADLDRGRAERLALLADLHLALERDELELVYQPKFDLTKERVTGAEALVRWRHPKLGLLSPDKFIPLAESTGLIEELTRQVLRMALHQAREWRSMGLDLTVAVNLSGRSIGDPALPERIGAALAEAGLPADRLVLEITESSALTEAAVTIPILERLAATGIALSLDDFGTGYSSLSYLHRLPVKEVKIDRSFVTRLGQRESAATSEALIRSVIGIAASLKLRTVAEGIEDEATLEQLRALGCDVAQGYHIGRPGTSEQLVEMVRPVGGPARHMRLVAG